MAASDVHVWRLGLDDVPEAAAVLARAFAHDQFFGTCIPDPVTRREHLPPFFAACLRYGCHFGRVYAGGTVPGRMDGVGWWYRFPDDYFDHERTELVGFGEVAALLGQGSDRIEAISGRVDAAMARVLPQPRANLDQIGVDPDWQGRGIGKALVGQIVADAAAEELPVALWTDSEANVAFYLRCGFQVAIDGSDGGDDIPWWAMLRPTG